MLIRFGYDITITCTEPTPKLHISMPPLAERSRLVRMNPIAESKMSIRVNPNTSAPDAINTMLALEGHVKQSELEQSLIELAKMRASQINGCASCLHMHSADARKAGESETRLSLLDAWRESNL